MDYKNVDYKNSCFDLYIYDRNLHIKIEYKKRDFRTGINCQYLKKNDVLIELFQSLYEIQKIGIIDNKNVNNKTNSERINISIGWFYKCAADRLFYLRYLDSCLYDIIDIDFNIFKSWFMNNLNKFKLQFAPGTTGTINAVVNICDIPFNMVNVYDSELKIKKQGDLLW